MIEYGIARKEQLPGILSLYKQLIPDDKPLDFDRAGKIWDEAAAKGITYFTAADGERVVSTLYLAIIPNLTREGKSIGFIENVITDEEYRRKGIGKKMIEMAVAYGEKSSCYKIVLLSNYKRKEAHLFYEQCGFDGNSKRGFEIRP